MRNELTTLDSGCLISRHVSRRRTSKLDPQLPAPVVFGLDEAFGGRRLKLADVLLPTRAGPVIRRRCVGRPTDHQAILLHRLGLNLPAGLEITTMW